MKKNFLETLFLLLHIYYCFLQEEQILKISKRGCPRDAWDPVTEVMGASGDVLGRSVKHILKIQLTDTLNLLWQVTQDFKKNGCGEKFSKQYNNLKNII